ncbi:MAG TPA: lysylphosphatidylglycerol synthase domain-containing protein, partial [Gaiellaceae bacterium]|nr:lysylphosphatidylglycerol synthase domain-containing protein [Gaiellaceae bacterium]
CAYAAGVALNAFLPARGGEGAKVLLARTQIPGSSVPAIAASLSVLVLLDGLLGIGLVAGLWAAGVLPGVPPLPSVPGGTPALAATALLTASLGVAALLARRVARALRGALEAAATGLAAFRSPRILFGTVVPLHLAAWAARVGVVHCVLLAFGVPAGLDTAVLVTVLSGLATAVPVPGGAGSQQLLASYALQGAISTAGAISFSMSMQLGITLVNTAVGLGATMLLFRTQRPLAALRALRER